MSNKKKKIMPDYLKGTDIGGGVNIYDDEFVTSPKVDLVLEKGVTVGYLVRNLLVKLIKET